MKHLLIWLSLLLCIQARSQNLTAVEYFFDDDPGIGNGTSIDVSPDDSLIVLTDIPTTSLGIGLHRLFVRVADENGHWSLSEGRSIYIQPESADLSADLIYAEYFFDDDPGEGNGTNLEATYGDSLIASTNIPTIGLAPGFHKLFVRTLAASGIWSLYEGRTFFIQSPPNPVEPIMVEAEYFYDEDPGPGNGTDIAVTPDDSLVFDYSIATTGLSEGFHKLFVRAKDSNDVWSLYEGRTLFIQQIPDPDTLQIVAAEYFYDTEPGLGLATVLEIIPGDSVDASFIIPQSLPEGIHTVNLRVMASNGQWSLTESRVFDSTVGVKDIASSHHVLYQNYPNPSNASTQIEFYLSKPENVQFEILDVTGKVIQLFNLSTLSSGKHLLRLEKSDMAQGTYCYRMITPTFSETRQMLLVH